MKRHALLVGIVLGTIDPTCTVAKICTPNYTDTVRPSSSYTNKLKVKQMASMHLPGDPSQYEEDHIIPLALCGSPKSPANLTPQMWDRARRKDVVEARFHRAVCAKKMKLEDAQDEIVEYE